MRDYSLVDVSHSVQIDYDIASASERICCGYTLRLVQDDGWYDSEDDVQCGRSCKLLLIENFK